MKMPDEKSMDAMAKLRHDAKFDTFREWLLSEYESVKESLVICQREDFEGLRGEARCLKQILKFINSDDKV